MGTSYHLLGFDPLWTQRDFKNGESMEFVINFSRHILDRVTFKETSGCLCLGSPSSLYVFRCKLEFARGVDYSQEICFQPAIKARFSRCLRNMVYCSAFGYGSKLSHEQFSVSDIAVLFIL